MSSATIERNGDNGAVSNMSDRDDDNTYRQDGELEQARNENLFSDFDDDDEFEDSDRDSDFAAIYSEEREEEPETPDPEVSIWELEEEPPEEAEFEEAQEEQAQDEPDLWGSTPNPPGSFDDEPPEAGVDAPMTAMASSEDQPDDEDWEDFEDEEDFEEEESQGLSISLGMIVVAIFALVLLGAGGYGVIEQRAQMQEEIRELQASLATAASPREVAQTRQAAEQVESRNTLLEQQVADLSRENRSLQAIVSGLEKQLAAQQEAVKPTPPKPTPEPAPEPTAKPAAPRVSASVTQVSGNWFVNFSSYSQRSTAESWAQKLNPEKGRVIVADGESNGRTIYRVRVVGLPDKASADAIARAMEKQYGLPRLWVGQSG